MKKILAVSLLSALIATPAMAAAPGAYVALDLQNWSTSNNSGLGNPSMGARIGAGYRFTPNIGAEVDYAQSGSTSSVGGVSDKISALQLAAVGTLPINQEFDVFAKIGLSANKASVSGAGCTSCSKTSLLYGIGGQYNINQNWGVRLQYENIGDVTNAAGTPNLSANTLSLGVVYAF